MLEEPVTAIQPLSKSVCGVCLCVGSLFVLCGGSCVFCSVSQEGAVLDDPVAAMQPSSKSVCYVCVCVCACVRSRACVGVLCVVCVSSQRNP